MKIIVVCGAGASSTFVATRLTNAARAAGVELTASAVPLGSVAGRLDDADALLLGAHLGTADDQVRALARDRGVRVRVLPTDIASDRDGSRTLAIATDPGFAA